MSDPPRFERFVLYDQNGNLTSLRKKDILAELTRGEKRYCRVIRPPAYVLSVYDTENKTNEEGIPFEGPFVASRFAEYTAELAKTAGLRTTPYKYSRTGTPAVVLVPDEIATEESDGERR